MMKTFLIPIIAAGLMMTQAAVAQESHVAWKGVYSSDFDSVQVLNESQEPLSGKLYIAPLDLSDIDIIERHSAKPLVAKKWALTDQEKEGLKAMYAKAYRHQFDESDTIQLVASEQDADIVIKTVVERIYPLAPKDEIGSRDPWTVYFSDGSGSMTVRFYISTTDGTYYDISDRDDAGSLWQRNNRHSNIMNIRRLFNHWASDIKDLLS